LVKPAAEVTCENVAHERVAPAAPAAATFFVLAGVGRDQDLGARVHDFVDLLLVPVASVRERDLIWFIAGHEPLILDPVNAWAATLILAVGLDLSRAGGLPQRAR
jgi:hypothetical protein